MGQNLADCTEKLCRGSNIGIVRLLCLRLFLSGIQAGAGRGDVTLFGQRDALPQRLIVNIRPSAGLPPEEEQLPTAALPAPYSASGCLYEARILSGDTSGV